MASVHTDHLVVGVDASPRRIGWAVAYGRRIVAADTWHVDATDDIRSRKDAWRYIRDVIRDAERKHATDLRMIGIEDVFIGPNRKGSLDMARTVGHVEAFAFASFPYAPMQRVRAATWRKLLGLPQRGKTASLQYARDVLDPTGLWDRLDDQDTADAICIAVALNELIEHG